jgi:hypothetical protein
MSVGTLDLQALHRVGQRLVTRRQRRTEGGVAPGESRLSESSRAQAVSGGRDAAMEKREPKLFIAAGILLTVAGFS